MGLVFDTEARETKGHLSWSEYRQIAGISLACTIDTESRLPKFYGDLDEEGTGHSIDELVHDLEMADFVVSYNGVGYDVPVLESTIGRGIRVHTHIDLWARIKESLNGTRWEKGSWKLDRVGRDTVGLGKTQTGGAFAPSLWREKRIGELTTYLYRDCLVLLNLWEFVLEHGYVLDPDGGELYIDAR